MKNLLIVALFFIGISTLNAQEWYMEDTHGITVPGYVITQEGLRIEANMTLYGPWEMVNGIWFAHPEKQKEGKKEKLRYYKASEFKEFGFEGYKFAYKKLPNFAKANLYVLIDDKASYYEYYEEVDNKKEIAYYVEVNGKILPANDIRFVNFKKFGAKYFGDCPELATRIADGEFSTRQLKEVVKEYNRLMAE